MSIVVFGSINMDLVTRTPRLPAPGETLTAHGFVTTPGGKGANQAVACARLDATTRMVGRVGDDVFGAALRGSLAQYGVDTTFVATEPGASGIAAIAVSDAAENTILIVAGANGAVGQADIAALDAALARALTLAGAGAANAAQQGTLDWSFALDAGLAQTLSAGQSVSATWRIAFTDDSGGPDATHLQDLTITLHGANDAPTITTPTPSGRVVEDSGGTVLSDGGVVGFADVDAGQNVRARAELLAVEGDGLQGAAGAALRAALDRALGLSGAGATHAANAGTLRWDFALDNALAQHLGQDQSVVATWRLTLNDDSGAARSTTTRDLTVTIVGSNDAPVATEDALTPALGGVAEGTLIAGSDTDADKDLLRVASVNGTPFEALAASTSTAHPAEAGWREIGLGHGTLYLQADGHSAYAHAGRAFIVTPQPGSGALEMLQGDGTWQALAAPTRLTLQALQAGALRYTPGPQEAGQSEATVAEVSEIDWRADGFEYTVSDGRTSSAPAQVSVTVGPGAEQFGNALAQGSDVDADGIPNRTEGALASRVSGEASLQSRAYTLMPAQLETAGAGQGLVLRLQAGLTGDLNADGRPDAAQGAVATFAWTGHDKFTAANADPFGLDGTGPIVTLVAEASATGTGTALEHVRIGDVQVRALSQEQAADFENRFRFGTAWSPLSFTASLVADAMPGSEDVDPTRDGVQWHFTIDISRSGESEHSYLGFVKWVDAATIERYRDAGTPLLDLQGRSVEVPGWIDFTRRTPEGDGAQLVRTADGRLLLDILITDNRFGDNDIAAGRLADPLLPVFVDEQDDRRPLTVTSPLVNEASRWAFFEIRGAAGQIVNLSLTEGSARGAGIDFGGSLEVSTDGGHHWSSVPTGAAVRLSEAGTLVARTPLIDDALSEGIETFRIVARTTGGLVVEGVASLRDDGTGVVFRSDGSVDPAGRATDDRPRPAPASARTPAAAEASRPSAASVAGSDVSGTAAAAIRAFDSALLVLRPSALGLPERAASAETLTSEAGFRSVVIESTRVGPALYRPVADQFFPSNRTGTFTVPADTFAHTRTDAILRLEARLADGRALPGWVVFDARTGTFRVTPPAGYAGDLEVRVVARDQDGREAIARFKLKVTAGVMVNPGRPSLSDQLGAAGTTSLRTAGGAPPGPVVASDPGRGAVVGTPTIAEPSARKAPLVRPSDRVAADAAAGRPARR